MPAKTVADLEALRDAMVERRRVEAYRVGSAHNDDGLEKLVRVHLAIEAVEAVIAEGGEEPAAGDPSLFIV